MVHGAGPSLLSNYDAKMAANTTFFHIFRKTLGKKQKSAHSALRNFISHEAGREDVLNELFSRWVDIELVETDTIWIFDLDSIVVSQYDDEAMIITSQSGAYKTKCCPGNQLCLEVSVQTADAKARPRKMQTKYVKRKDSNTLVTMWLMHDESEETAVLTKTEPKNMGILHSLVLLERVISLNLHQEHIALYRGAIHGKSHECNETIFHLWSVKCPITAEFYVTCLDYCDDDPDTLCVGYSKGPARLASSKGLVCCWFLRNLLHPECHFYCRSGVTAIDVCIRNLSRMLAVGMSDGSVAVYDITGQVQQIIDSLAYFEAHSSPVLSINWISCTQDEKDQTQFITASTDGYIFRWQLHFQFSKTIFMSTNQFSLTNLADFTRPTEQCSTTQGILAVAFQPTRYLIATEVGVIYLCSVQHNDRCLKSYRGHRGPVHRVIWCPNPPDYFISCGADWTIKLWDLNLDPPILTFQSNLTSVLDVVLSPMNPTMFASVRRESVEIWDLSESIFKPAAVWETEEEEEFTTAVFAPFTNNLMVGTTHGEVMAFNINLRNKSQDTLENLLGKYSSNSLYLRNFFS